MSISFNEIYMKRIKFESNSKFWMILLLSAFGYFVAWYILTYPYRLFPTDDNWFLAVLTKKVELGTDEIYHPVFFYFMFLIKTIWDFLSNDIRSVFLIAALLCNTVTLAILATIIYRLSGKYTLSIIAIVLWAFSAWPANYYFWGSYTTISTMIFMLSFYLLLESYLYYNNNLSKSFSLLILSSILAGFYAWSTASSPPVILVLLLAFVLLYNKKLLQKKRYLIYIVLFFIIWGLFFAVYRKGFIEHLHINLTTDHYSTSMQKFGYIPETPFFSFFHVQSVYSNILSVSFLILNGLYVFYLIIKCCTKQKITRVENIVNILLLMVWCHLLVIDFLPFTKLGRTHFVMYPLFVTSFIFLLYFMYRHALLFVAKHHKLYMGLRVMCLLILGGVVVQNIQTARELIIATKSAPAFLNQFISEIKFYTLEADPHTYFISDIWLHDIQVNPVSIEEFNHVRLTKGVEEKTGLIVGPTGKNSGRMSIIYHRIFNDLYMKEIQNQLNWADTKKVILLPYYTTFPTFVMEEEIMQGLYFEGQLPDYRSKSQHLKLLLF